MSIRRLFSLCFVLSCVLSPSAPSAAGGADAATCSYEPDDMDQAPQVTPARMTLAGKQVRAFHTSFVNPVDPVDEVGEAENAFISGRARPFTSKIKSEHLPQLDFYGLPSDVFLSGSDGVLAVPKGWRLVDGRIGANGSATVTFKPPTGPGYLTFHQTSACVGCAYAEAAPFFPEARRLCREFYDDKDSCRAQLRPSVQHVKLKPHVVGYRLEGQGGNRTDGVASFNAAVDAPKYWEATVCLPPGQLHLGNPILNRFLSIYRGN